MLLLLLLRQRVTDDGGQQIDLIRESRTRAPVRWLSIISWPTPRHATPPKSMRRSVARSVSTVVLISVSDDLRPARDRPAAKSLVTHSFARSDVHRSPITSLPRPFRLCFLVTRRVQAFRHWEQEQNCQTKLFFLFRFLRPSEFQTKLCKYVRFVWNVFFLSYSANSIQCSSLTRFGLNTWLVWTTFTVSRQKAVWFDVTHCRLAGGLPRCSVLVSPLSEIYAPALTAFAARPFDGNHRQSVRLQSRRALILWL